MLMRRADDWAENKKPPLQAVKTGTWHEALTCSNHEKERNHCQPLFASEWLATDGWRMDSSLFLLVGCETKVISLVQNAADPTLRGGLLTVHLLAPLLPPANDLLWSSFTSRYFPIPVTRSQWCVVSNWHRLRMGLVLPRFASRLEIFFLLQTALIYSIKVLNIHMNWRQR